MNFIIFGVLAPILYWLIRMAIKSFVINFINNAKRNSGVKNMTQCSKCKMFVDEEDMQIVDGDFICNKPECKT